MFEKRLNEISRKIGEHPKKKFYILTHKKHRREIYFQNNKDSIEFMNLKFNNSLKKFKILKKILYILIKLRILQIFLKKIKISSNFGNVIFIGGQIKGFDLKNNLVNSFPLKKEEEKSFLKLKKAQKENAKKRFASEIIEINNKIPFSKEELLKEYSGGKDIEIFKKLYSFYKSEGIIKVPLGKYAFFLIKNLKSKGINEKDLFNLIKKDIKSEKEVMITTLHGDFAKEQVLLKKENFVFVDWNSKKGLIISDLINFFRGEKNLLKNIKFIEILREVFPKEVQENIKLYILLNEISTILRTGKINKLSKKRISNNY
jgi:hypothetical protein